MSNFYNELTPVQKFGQGMQRLIARKLRAELMFGSQLSASQTYKKSKSSKYTIDTQMNSESQNPTIDIAFFHHF